MHALVYVEVRRQPLGLVSREPFTLVFWGKVPHWSSLMRLVRLASTAQVSAFLCFHWATKLAFFTLFGSGEWTQVPCLHEKQFTVSLKFPLLKGAKQNPKRIIANISLQSMPGTTLTTGARARVQLSGGVLRSIHGVLGSTTSTKGRKQEPTTPLVIS